MSSTASVGHLAVAAAAQRAAGGPRHWRLLALLCGLSLAPDLDVIAFVFAVPYGAEWGHRGASHSLLLAVLVGAGVGYGLRRSGALLRAPELVCVLVLASHGLLDSLTDGGKGVALFWPWSLARHFAPWRPIPVAPIGLGMFSPWGLQVLVQETLMFLPAWLYAFWPRGRPGPGRWCEAAGRFLRNFLRKTPKT